MIDLDAYFARIGYAGPRSATLDTLRAIHALHPRAIPFENLDPLLGRPVPLDLSSLQAKLIRARRGGYCFEHNTLFRAVLEQLGFAVTTLAARVLWMLPPDAPANPRTHMLLRVELAGGPYIADVGFGANLSAAPIRLVTDVEQAAGSGRLRLVRDADEFTLQVWSRGAWQSAYRFTLEPQLPIDMDVANWFTATHPASRFRTGLMLQRLLPEGRISVLNRSFTRRTSGGGSEERVLESAEALGRVLAEDFELEPPFDPAEVLARVP